MGGNNVIALQSDIFVALTQLRLLSISFMQLAVIPYDLFATLTELNFLVLSGNLLSVLPTGIFSSLSNLTSLYMNLNHLNTVDALWFVQSPHMGRLSLLDLTQNNISKIELNMHEFW